MAARGGARSVEQWRRYLAEYSADVLRVVPDEELHHVRDGQRAAGWLGFDGADEDRLVALEQRLGARLPSSYRAFLAASDGWQHISSFMWEMRTTGNVGWLRDVYPGFSDMLRDCGLADEAAIADRALQISGAGDAQYWLLDPGRVSADGEWAAYIWASWYPGLGHRHDSFATLVDAERASFEQLSGRAGRPVHPDGVDELVAEGRRRALLGDVRGAADAFAQSAVKGSGVGQYLAIMLDAFLDSTHTHHAIRNNVFGKPHVVEAVGREQVRAEAVPLFLQGMARTGSPLNLYRQLLVGILTEEEIERIDGFTPPVLPEPPAFQEALRQARVLAGAGAADQAWAVLVAGLRHWRSDSPHRIAPVVLLTDPALRQVVTPERAESVVTTLRGGNPWDGPAGPTRWRRGGRRGVAGGGPRR